MEESKRYNVFLEYLKRAIERKGHFEITKQDLKDLLPGEAAILKSEALEHKYSMLVDGPGEAFRIKFC